MEITPQLDKKQVKLGSKVNHILSPSGCELEMH